MPTIPTPANLRRTAELVLRDCIPLLTLQDEVSHVAYRTASKSELKRVLQNAECIGTVKIDHQKKRTYYWLLLHQPIVVKGPQEHQINAFEFPVPRENENRPSGFYACVYHQPSRQSPPVPMDREVCEGLTLRLISALPKVLAALRQAA